ncbi:hypothetical protein [Mycoplasma phocoeninasale]|uniref:hypothetical protein n=1 Tax=Mycoplasma phocoeninasale TaxID=2726117 RepID=UPI0019687030|nr:hypothetical protein [Mycoplasma phocoeninasale]MBN0970432.1 hypothetical protein [Mycoplasma phocoeninasale]
MKENKRKNSIKLSIVVLGAVIVPILVGVGIGISYATSNKAKIEIQKEKLPNDENGNNSEKDVKENSSN